MSREAALDYHSAAVERREFLRAEETIRAILAGGLQDRRLQFLLIDLLLRQQREEAALTEIEAAMAEFGTDDGIVKAGLAVRSKLGYHAPRAKPWVSLCMIVKDEEEHLARCLRSAKPVVDEIVVADTGSADRSADIARVFGARVFHHPWEGDFSKARNAVLSQARGEWIFVLDGDEVLSPRDYDRFRQTVNRPGPAAAYSIRTRNYTFQVNTVGWQPNGGGYAAEEAGAGWFPSDKVRLFPNDPGVRFTYPVHEVVEPSLQQLGIAVLPCDIPVHHYGKLRLDRERGKTSAYRAIGREKLALDQDDPAAVREAAIQASHLERHEEALALWRQFLLLKPGSVEAFINLGSANFNLRRYSEAAACAEKAVALNPGLKEAHFNSAIAQVVLGRAERAVAILDPLVQREPDYPAARFLLAAAHACTGAADLFQAGLGRLASSPLGAYLSISIADLAERLLTAGQRGYARQLLHAAASRNFASPQILSLLEACQPAA